MGLPTGVAKIVAFKKQAADTWGQAAAGGAGAQMLRRVESMLDTEMDQFESDEIVPDYQVTDHRHGQQRTKGQLRGRFSGSAYKDFIAGFLANAWQVAPTTGAQVNITAGVGPVTFTRGAGSYITDGFRVGQIVNWVGWATTGTANNNRYFLITTLTATVMTGVFLDGTAGGAKAAGDSVTCTLSGKQVWIPQTGHTKDLFTIEEYHPDMTVTQSETFISQYVNSIALAKDPKGFVGIDLGFLGYKQNNATAAPYFTGPTAVTNGGLHTVIDGALYIGGAAIADVTGFTVNYDGGAALAEPTYGTRYPADVFPGRRRITGQMSCYFRDGTFRDNYLNENEIAFIGVSRAGMAAQSESFGVVLPRVKLNSANKGDGQNGVIRTYDFVALNNRGGTGADQTTVAMQDTTVV